MSAKKQKQTRVERLEAARRERRRRQLRNRLLMVGVPLVLLGLLGLVLVGGGDEPPPEVAESEACTQDSKSDDDRGAGRNHIPNPTYEVDPPAGGNHEPSAAQARAYRVGSVPSDGQLVHAMEHGFVIFWHRPDVSDEDREALESLQSDLGGSTLLVPRQSLDGPVAATAWHRRLLCTDVDIPALRAFARTYKDKGPERGFVRD